MQLPKYNDARNPARKKKLKACEICGKEYYGHVIGKYCEFHQDIKNRKRIRKKYIDIVNMNFEHGFNYSTKVEFTCSLPGCDNRFEIMALPRLSKYPQYCPVHRNEFKRQWHMRQLKCA